MEIMNKNLTIAFDIEGTLLNNKGKLDPDVLPIFEKADFKNTNFIFLTGGNISLADYAIEQIRNAVPEFKSSRFWVALNGGSHVRGPSGISKIEAFNAVRLGRFISNARAYDNDCFLIYVTEKGNFIDIPASHFAKTAFWFYNKKDKSKGNAALNLQPIEGLKQGRSMQDIEAEIGPIQQLFVKSFNKNAKSKVYYALKKEAGNEYSVYKGRQIAIPARNKLAALQCILDTAHSIPSCTMPANIEDVIYFGDDENDVECLKKCKISVARGEQASDTVKKFAKFKLNNLAEFAENLYSGKYNDLLFNDSIKKDTAARVVDEETSKAPEEVIASK